MTNMHLVDFINIIIIFSPFWVCEKGEKCRAWNNLKMRNKS